MLVGCKATTAAAIVALAASRLVSVKRDKSMQGMCEERAGSGRHNERGQWKTQSKRGQITLQEELVDNAT